MKKLLCLFVIIFCISLTSCSDYTPPERDWDGNTKHIKKIVVLLEEIKEELKGVENDK